MFTTTHTFATSSVGDDSRPRYSAIMEALQDCSNFHIDSLDNVMAYFTEHNVGMYVVYRQADIVRHPEYREKVGIATCVYECKTIFGFRNTSIVDSKGNFLVKSYVAGAFVDLSTGRPVKVPQALIDTVEMTEKVDMDYLPRKIAVDSSLFRPNDVYRVRRDYLDFNKHVNNAKYFDIAADILPDVNYTRLRAEYRAPAKLGDVIVPWTYDTKDKFYVELSEFGNRTNVFCVLEYSFV
ncbi:acyl-ACP thioesterase [Clostridia bacterium]|nr:acyl-ACP thioesterase [Clostridia bacterium]